VKKPLARLPDSWWRPLQRRQHTAQLFVIRGTLPPEFRARLGLQWTDKQQRRFARFSRVVRVSTDLVPVSLRSSYVRSVGRINVWLRARRRLRAF
jgi:uncharacterized protein (DUF2236 family)